MLAGAPEQHAGAAAGVLATAQQLANALGVALVSLAFFGALDHHGYATAFTISLDGPAALALMLAGLAWRLQRQS